MLTPQCI